MQSLTTAYLFGDSIRKCSVKAKKVKKKRKIVYLISANFSLKEEKIEYIILKNKVMYLISSMFINRTYVTNGKKCFAITIGKDLSAKKKCLIIEYYFCSYGRGRTGGTSLET